MQWYVNGQFTSFHWEVQNKQTLKLRIILTAVSIHRQGQGVLKWVQLQKLKLPHRKTNQGLRALSYVGPFLWNKLDNSLKMSASLNTFKHNLKNQYFQINKN